MNSVTDSSPSRLPEGDVGQVHEVESEQSFVPYDENLLERARTQWQFGDWQSLSQLNRDTLQHHPARATLALLAAAGRLQIDSPDEAREYLRLANDWGVRPKLLCQVIAAGVHNSLGRAAALTGQRYRALKHFESSITVGNPGSDKKLLTQARTGEQLRQLGLFTLDGYKKFGFDETARKNNIQPSSIEILEKPVNEKYTNISSRQYWEERYQKGGTSGFGSYGRLAEFKANVINKFIEDEGIEFVIEFGCGDGNQLSMLRVKNYVGVDISPTIVEKCKQRFKDDTTKLFLTDRGYLEKRLKGMLTLSLDVIFHLIEDDVFENYMSMLFNAAERYCIIYSCDEDWLENDAIHVRRRKFSKWIADNLKEWRLMQVTYNKYPHDGSPNPMDLSFSNFYFYERVS